MLSRFELWEAGKVKNTFQSLESSGFPLEFYLPTYWVLVIFIIKYLSVADSSSHNLTSDVVCPLPSWTVWHFHSIDSQLHHHTALTSSLVYSRLHIHILLQIEQLFLWNLPDIGNTYQCTWFQLGRQWSVTFKLITTGWINHFPHKCKSVWL